MTKTQKTATEKAIRKIEKCNGDCKHCEHLKIPSKGTYYAFICGIADKAGYASYSNTIKDLRSITLECLLFELS